MFRWMEQCQEEIKQNKRCGIAQDVMSHHLDAYWKFILLLKGRRAYEITDTSKMFYFLLFSFFSFFALAG